MKKIRVEETRERDLENIQKLWADGDVMKFVGFPDGLKKSIEDFRKWYSWIEKLRPSANHYSIYDGDIYCGESFYRIDKNHDNSTSLDIKLFSHARGKGIASKALNLTINEAFRNGALKVWVDPNPNNIKAIALYERLGFERQTMPEYLIDDEGNDAIYMEKSNK